MEGQPPCLPMFFGMYGHAGCSLLFGQTQGSAPTSTQRSPLLRAPCVVPSSWEEGLGVVERNTVLTYFIGLALFFSTTPDPSFRKEGTTGSVFSYIIQNL